MADPTRAPLREYVTFRAPDPAGDGDSTAAEGAPEPRGRDLAVRIGDALRAVGYDAALPHNRDDFAWQFDVQRGTAKFFLMCGYMGDDVREWLLLSKSRTGWLASAFGKGNGDEHRRLSEALDQIVRGLGGESVRWYTEKQWDRGDPDDEWTEHP